VKLLRTTIVYDREILTHNGTRFGVTKGVQTMQTSL